MTFKDAVKTCVPQRWRRPKYRVEHVIRKRTGLIVARGPFKGMKYSEEMVERLPPWPRILGTYEQEIYACIEDTCSSTFTRVINVGAAEGYYAVGLLMRLPGATGVAFEASAAFRESIRDLASINGVADRLDVAGFCDVAALKEHMPPGEPALVFMDVEGHEKELLDPVAIPQLATAHVIVEVHEQEAPSVTKTLKSGFGTSHNIEIIQSRPRRLADLPFTLPLIERLFMHRTYLSAMSEGCGRVMTWMNMVPVAGRSGT